MTDIDPYATCNAYVLAALFEISPESIRQWAKRRRIGRYGQDQGLTQYRVVEVAVAVRDRGKRRPDEVTA